MKESANEKTYPYTSPQEWLLDKISTLRNAGDASGLASLFLSLATSLDNEAIQDVCQHEMEADGFFTATHCACGEELDRDCNGEERCPTCDPPCSCCGAGYEDGEDDSEADAE